MPDKNYVLKRLIIFPNTSFPKLKRFVIAGVDTNNEYYYADTNTESVYKDFWSADLTNEQKVPAIQQMLRDLEAHYGDGNSFNYIQRNEPDQE